MAKGYWVTFYRWVRDPAALAEYGKLAVPAIEAGGGRILARGVPGRAAPAARRRRAGHPVPGGPRVNPAVHVVVFDGFADWEPAYALAELTRSGGLEVVAAGFTRDAVRSMGGLR